MTTSTLSCTSSDLSRDPVYRSMVRAAMTPNSDPSILGAISDYREERGMPRLAKRSGRLAKKEKVLTNPSYMIDMRTPEQVAAADVAAAEAARRKVLEDLAVAVGRAYHAHCVRLYQSKYASVLYGRGGQETSDRDRYSKGWHNSFGPATCCNGGARILTDENGKDVAIVLENHRGTEKARLPMPPKDADLANLITWIRSVV